MSEILNTVYLKILKLKFKIIFNGFAFQDKTPHSPNKNVII